MTPRKDTDDEIKTIDEKTSIPLYAVLISIPAVVGAVFWISMVSAKANETEARLDRQADKIHRMESDDNQWRSQTLKDLSDMKASLARIEGRLSITDK